MKKLFVAAWLFFAVGKAFADISDSGNLSIGGQGIIQGTMTVVGGSIGISTSNPNAQLGVQSTQGPSNFVLQVSSQNSTTMFAIDGSGKLYTPSGGPVANGVLFSNSGAPSWTNSPTLNGTNFSGIPAGAIDGGGLPTSITVSTANIVPGFNGANELLQLDGSGNLNVNGSAQFGSGVTKSTFSTTGALTLSKNAALTLIGGSGNIVSASSITASAFFGDGSNLSGVATNQMFEVMVASIDVYNVYASTFDATYLTFASSTSYRLHYVLMNISGASSGYFVQLGTGSVGSLCDFNANYGQQNNYFNAGASGTGGPLTPSYYGWALYADAAQEVQVLNNGTIQGDLWFETGMGSSATWKMHGMNYQETSNSVQCPALLSGYYKSGKSITQVCITGSSGYFTSALTRNQKFSGHFEIWKGPSHK